MKAVLVGFMVLFVVVLVSFGITYVNTSNEGTRYEVGIEKQHKATQNVLSAYTLKVQEMAQVPDKYKEDLKGVISATFEGRYGKDGSKAVMQWIQEQNLQFDSKLYLNLQAVMEAGRDEFKLAQDKKLDICGNYEAARGYVVKGWFLGFAGFPKKDVDTLCKIVLDTKTNKTFETGLAEPISIK